jgi:hypothetical protein
VNEVFGSDTEIVNDEANYELNPGSDNGSVNDEVNPTNKAIANFLSQPM